jgi:hypothetical protein
MQQQQQQQHMLQPAWGWQQAVCPDSPPPPHLNSADWLNLLQPAVLLVVLPRTELLPLLLCCFAA